VLGMSMKLVRPPATAAAGMSLHADVGASG